MPGEHEWMSAKDALMRASAILGKDRARGALSLRQKARRGLVKCRAGIMSAAIGPPPLSDLPASFWSEPRGLLGEAIGPVGFEEWDEAIFDGFMGPIGLNRAIGVQFRRRDIDRYYPVQPESNASATGSIGRPEGSGSFALADQPRLKEMHDLLMKKKVFSVTKAAQAVASEAQGSSFEAKVKRLVRRYQASKYAKDSRDMVSQG